MTDEAINPTEIMSPKEQVYAHLYNHPGPLSPQAIKLLSMRVQQAKEKGRG